MSYKQLLQHIQTIFNKHINHPILTLAKKSYTRITIDSQRNMQINVDKENAEVQCIIPIDPDNIKQYASQLELSMFPNQLTDVQFILIRDTNDITLLKDVGIGNLTLLKLESIFQKLTNPSKHLETTLEENETTHNEDSEEISELVINDVINRA